MRCDTMPALFSISIHLMSGRLVMSKGARGVVLLAALAGLCCHVSCQAQSTDAPGASVTGDDWPGFRGPDGMGVSDAAELPLEWDADNNVVWNTTGAGIYEHDAANQIFCGNFIGRTKGPAMWLRGAVTDRTMRGRPLIGGRHVIAGNLLYRNRRAIVTDDPHRLVAGNVSKGITARLDRKTLKLTWRCER